ncbi:MAG: NTP transferase domain-containing protein [Candidatus Hydrogenedentes bacterium]|nr:NTP transferase domain-containing protein [Candidatus Hydrogenedentota bacterium]
MKAVILAAGQSTRTFPLTLTRPKALLPVANQTILDHQLAALEGIVDEVVLVVGYRQEMVRARYGEEHKGKRIHYVEQREQKGTGHAVLQCVDLVDGPFLAMNGDDIYDDVDVRKMAEAPQGALTKMVLDPRQYGIYAVDTEMRVQRIEEKPKEIFSNLANIGVYKFTPEVFKVLRDTAPSPRGEIEITSAIQTLAKHGDFFAVESEGYWLPIIYPWHLIEANTYMLDNELWPDIYGDVSSAAHITGNVIIGRGTEIRAGVVIDGPVVIGENCEIGPNCFVRPGTSIGNGCRVGQSSELKNSILMDGAKVPHLSYLGDSVLGEDVNIGCGTITANLRHDGKNVCSMVKGELVDTGRRKLGAILGDHVHTGINTSLYPGRKLWPNTSTRPGQIVDQDILE